jgi:hypothetical protein
VPRRELVVRIFLASPGDVVPERKAVERVKSELNLTLPSLAGLRFELVGWETHSYPGFGVDAQDVINRQISDYDVFIGIMWARFGSPTARAGSGTEEEFNRALSLWLSHPAGMRLMFYFKNGVMAPSDIDPGQLASVKRFRRRLHAAGGLSATFTTTDDLERQLRVHLLRLAQEFMSSPARARSLPTQMESRDTSQTEASLVLRIVQCFSTARFVKDGTMISFGVDDPLLSADIARRLEALGAITDWSFDREIVKVPRDAFAALVDSLLPPDRREIVRKALIQAGVPDGNWKSVLRSALAKAAEKIAGVAGEEATKEIQDLAGPAIKDLFMSVTKQVTARWRGLLT